MNVLISQGKTKDRGKNRSRQKEASSQKRRLAVMLSPDLMGEHRVGSIVVREGDTVSVRRGDWALQEGKVMRVNTAMRKIFVENIKRESSDGKELLVPLTPENIMITKLNLDDKWRKKIIERRGFVSTT